ncbi:MAG TPA: RluA family pseudouridine synthase [Myxococcota bacterium]
MSDAAPLSIVHHGEGFAVIDKPSGLLSCPGRDPALFDSVQSRVPHVFHDASGSILVHRLDQWTSGLIVVALDVAAHRALRLQFEARTVEKTYEAELVGDVVGDHGVLALPFRLDVDRRPYQIYDLEHGKLGITHWQVLARRDDADGVRTRVAFQPHTGRTHQLRTHAAHALGLNAAIAGDALSGDVTTSSRRLLHARAISFDHPRTGERQTFSSPTPY